MSSRPEEPAADDRRDVRWSPSDDDERDAASAWEVPHQTQAPSVPLGTPGTFRFEDGRAEPRERTHPRPRIDIAAGATVVGNLPWIAGSFIVVVMILWLVTSLFSIDFLLPPLTWAWLLSGAIVFVPAAEPHVAQYILGLRPPSRTEAVQINAAWRMVATEAGIDPDTYSVWVDEHADVNACQPGGRFLSVSTEVMHLPPRQQAALLAHELSHQLGGHTWVRMLVEWYSAPARWLVRMYRAVLSTTRRGGQVAGSAGAVLGCLLALVWVILGVAVVGGLITTPALRPAIVVLPFLPWLSRWAEKRCDRVAADLGFGTDLMDLFRYWQESGRDNGSEGGLIRRLFASRPTIGNRMHALQTYLTEKGLS